MSNYNVLKAANITGTDVKNPEGENLGNVKEIVVDTGTGRVAHAVLSFGGFLGLGDKLFAIPFSALTHDSNSEEFILNIDKERLENAPGFDKNDWPDMADQQWGLNIYNYYRQTPYWDQ